MHEYLIYVDDNEAEVEYIAIRVPPCIYFEERGSLFLKNSIHESCYYDILYNNDIGKHCTNGSQHKFYHISHLKCLISSSATLEVTFNKPVDKSKVFLYL
jgi:predicted enzyme involved in methoxymalonyl-ACP biosynthesis